MILVVYFLIAVELMGVCYGDVKYRKIYNFWSLFNLCLFITFTMMFPKIYPWSWQIFIFPMSFLIIGFILFAFKIMGGGDCKFLSTFFMLVPPYLQESYVYHLLYTTVIVGVCLMVFNTLQNIPLWITIIRTKELSLLRTIYGTKFVFSPVIAVAWMWFGLAYYLR